MASNFNVPEVISIISRLIHDLYSNKKDWVKRADLLKALIADKDGRLLAGSAWERFERDGKPMPERLEFVKSKDWLVKNMLAHFSKVYTEGGYELKSKFERTELGGYPAYKPRQKEKRSLVRSQDIAKVISEKEREQAASGIFNPENIQDGREKTLATIVSRRGQPEFRRRLLKSYEGRCAIAGTDAEEALEAAHILPYKGKETNHPSNGLLLRADLHALFDLGLIAINTSNMTVILAPKLLNSSYKEFAGKKLTVPANTLDLPSIEALNIHRQEAGL